MLRVYESLMYNTIEVLPLLLLLTTTATTNTTITVVYQSVNSIVSDLLIPTSLAHGTAKCTEQLKIAC
jgi:hypothetical protein